MSDRIRLDGYLPVRLGATVGFSPELSVDSIIVDVPAEAVPEAGSSRVVTLLCAPDLEVRAAVTVLDGAMAGAPAGLLRVLLRVDRFEDSGRADLIAHFSSLRKTSHLSITATEDVEAARTRAGWDGWRLPHVALPERHPDELDLHTDLLGKRLAAPVMISGMTGGSRRAGDVNRRLAIAAQELGLAMGLGSQRAMLESGALTSTFAVRDVAPDILLLGNIGAAQLNLGVGVDDCRRLVDAVGADALAVHLNPLQEMIQPEGDRDWRGLLPKIGRLVQELGVPVLVKETGCGISGPLAKRLVEVGVAAIDVGGTGGTAWGWIEGFRTASPHRRAIGATFREWGIPTVTSLIACRAAVGPDFPLVSTGGVRTGLDVATAVALGADVAGMALPFFRAADKGEDDAVDLGRRVVEEVRIATFCAGVGAPGDLRGLAVPEACR